MTGIRQTCVERLGVEFLFVEFHSTECLRPLVCFAELHSWDFLNALGRHQILPFVPVAPPSLSGLLGHLGGCCLCYAPLPLLIGSGVAMCPRSRRESVTRGFVSEVAEIEMHDSEFVDKLSCSILLACLSEQTYNSSVTLVSRQLQS